MITVSVEFGQVALLIVQTRVADVPITNPVTPDVGDDGEVTVAVPDITLQAPEPVVGVFADNAVVVELHKFWSEPAFDVVGKASMIIVMSSDELGQKPLLIVHLSVTLVPAVKPVIPVVDNVAVVIVAAPLITLHIPVPVVGTLPASVAVVVLHKF